MSEARFLSWADLVGLRAATLHAVEELAFWLALLLFCASMLLICSSLALRGKDSCSSHLLVASVPTMWMSVALAVLHNSGFCTAAVAFSAAALVAVLVAIALHLPGTRTANETTDEVPAEEVAAETDAADEEEAFRNSFWASFQAEAARLSEAAASEPPVQLLAHTCASFARAMGGRVGRGGRLELARALYADYWRDFPFFLEAGDGRYSLSLLPMPSAQHRGAELYKAPQLAARLLAATDARAPLRFASAKKAPAARETEKYVLVAEDGMEVEMVAMPAPGGAGEWSLCVSSQVGCQMGCTFCETGRMGLLRDLTAAEIVAQFALARFALGLRVTNVVFMGMGEPLDNLDAVIGAVQVMTDPVGAKLPMSSVTVSTSGDAAKVYPLLEALPRVRMAFSVHAADDATRSKLMPINRRVGLAALADAMRFYISQTKRRVTIQYVLLEGVNDSEAHAAQLDTFLQTVGPKERLHINLIPYNEQSRPQFATPSAEVCKAFKQSLTARQYFVKIA